MRALVAYDAEKEKNIKLGSWRVNVYIGCTVASSELPQLTMSTLNHGVCCILPHDEACNLRWFLICVSDLIPLDHFNHLTRFVTESLRVQSAMVSITT